MRPTATLALLGVIALAAPARADVTADDAAALAKSFDPFLGSAALNDGFIKVVPHGRDYEISIDLSRALPAPVLPGFEFNLGHWSFLTHPLGNGTWQVTSDALPSTSLTLPSPQGPQTYVYHFDAYTFSGVYDPKLASFTTSTSSLGKLGMVTHAASGDSEVQVSGLRFSTSATPDDQGTVASKLNETYQQLDETLSFDPSGGKTKQAAPISVGIHGGAGSGTASIAALRLQNLMDLWTFAVAHPSPASGAGGQDQLKTLLATALPIWDQLDLHASAKDISITTPRGAGSVKEINESLTTTGISQDTSIALGFGFTGLSLPDKLLPAAFDSLVPTRLDLALRLDDVDLDAPARALISALDFSQSPPVSVGSALSIMAPLIKAGVHLSLDGSEVATSKLDILIDGDLSLTAEPSGEMTLQASGLDDTIAELRGAGSRNPLLQEAQGVLIAAKHMAKIGADDKAVWVIKYAPSGDITVNGRLVRAGTQ